MKIIFTSLLILLSLLSQATAHGLRRDENKALLFAEKGALISKIELSPNSIDFGRVNELRVSIIDREESAIYSGDIRLALTDELGRSVDLEESRFSKGLFATALTFYQGEKFLLRLFLGDELTPSFQFKLEPKNNRTFALLVLGITFSLVTIFFILFSLFCKKQRSETNETELLGGK